MPQIYNNNPLNQMQSVTPLQNYYGNYNNLQPNSQTVTVTPDSNSQIYNYPQASIYGTNDKKQASAVNIYINNPSALGGPVSNTMPSIPNMPQNSAAEPVLANTPISNNNETTQTDKTEKKEKEKKKVVELTDDYIKTLESYLKSPDKAVRKDGITELINRFEEDDTRYKDPALTALLNTALLDPDANNRLMAISLIAGGNAKGDEKTAELLKECQKSDKLYGQEAALASKALLKSAENKKEV